MEVTVKSIDAIASRFKDVAALVVRQHESGYTKVIGLIEGEFGTYYTVPVGPADLDFPAIAAGSVGTVIEHLSGVFSVVLPSNGFRQPLMELICVPA